jgi:hypothetical protein
VDGDLFKVILTLPLLDEKREPQPPQETETLPEEAPPAEMQDAEKAKKDASARRGHRTGFGKNPARWLYRKLQYIVEDEEK